MAEILDQNEINALLNEQDGAEGDGVGGGDGVGDGDAPEVHLYSRRLGGLQHTQAEVRTYDFKSPERVSKDQMHALEHLHEGFARSFGAALSGFMRTIMEVKVRSIEQMTFREFTSPLPNPTCFNLLSCEPLEGRFCLELSPLIIYPVIDRLLGGSNADLFVPQRPLTAIELRLVDRILRYAVECLGEAWATVHPLEFAVTETESNPALVQIVPPNEVVVVVNYEMTLGNRTGTMALCIPYAVIEPVVEKLNNQAWASYRKSSKDTQHRVRVVEHLEGARLDVAAILAETKISVQDLTQLEVGDVILTEKPAAAPLALDVNGRRKFIGHLGQFKGKRAFKVARGVKAKDRW